MGSVRDTELYRHLLGLESPWAVSRVELSVAEGKVDVWVDHPARTRWRCPDCDRELSVYDHADERAWRHLDSCQFLTYLHARPRLIAPTMACARSACPRPSRCPASPACSNAWPSMCSPSATS